MGGMRVRATAVPASVSFLLDPGLTATAKVLWLTLRHEGVPVGPKRLGTWTGFTQVTVRKGLAQLEARGWYNGVQHYHTTERFPSARALSERQFRDAVKRVLCEERSITLVVVTRRDLSLRGMQAKIGKLLPRRDLRGHEDLIEFLERLKK